MSTGETEKKPTTYEPVLPRPPIPPGPYLVVGLARSGQAAAQLLASRGAEVFGVDGGKPAGAETLGDFGVDAHVESSGLELLDRVATVIKSPGVPSDAPVIAAAREAGLPVIGELELAWRLIDNPVIAVTGTNGKTTTTSLLGKIYQTAGLPYELAGNIGTPLCALAATISRDATVICEVSSFQLDDAPEFTPECGVLLNITEDHLDRYESFEHYRQSKLSMFERQGPGQFAVSGPAIDFELPGEGFKARVTSAGFNNDDGAVALRGRHNIDNALVAAHAALLMGVDPAAIDHALRTFGGVEHRMEVAGETNGVEFINDSKATNVDAAVAALAGYEHPVRLIVGGSLKGQGFKSLAPAVGSSAAAVYAYGDAAGAIVEDIKDAGVPVERYEVFEDAVRAAAEAATAGEVVLLSPACASFDQHDNYEHRGDEFKRIVGELTA